jgi:Sulfotransferase family
MAGDPNEQRAGAKLTPPPDVSPAAPARRDPVRGAVPGQELIYETLQRLWSAWARVRYRDELQRVTTFCLFIGYPRSGHSLVGAMLNAHREAVISHELDVFQLVADGCSRDELFSRILARAAWFNLRGNRSNYRYQIPNKWQGRFETLRVIGDKRGGTAAQWLARRPDVLDRLRALVGVPVRMVHVVRNPYDNIAAIARWHNLTLDASIEFYFSHFHVTGQLEALAPSADVVTIRHEDFFHTPEKTLSNLCAFLGLDSSPSYLAECSSIVFARPTAPRRRTEWTSTQVSDVARRVTAYPFLAGYAFDADDASERASDEAPGRVDAPKALGGNPLLDRLAAYVNPRVREGRSPSAAVGSFPQR